MQEIEQRREQLPSEPQQVARPSKTISGNFAEDVEAQRTQRIMGFNPPILCVLCASAFSAFLPEDP
jgi:hypothetical protein